MDAEDQADTIVRQSDIPSRGEEANSVTRSVEPASISVGGVVTSMEAVETVGAPEEAVSQRISEANLNMGLSGVPLNSDAQNDSREVENAMETVETASNGTAAIEQAPVANATEPNVLEDRSNAMETAEASSSGAVNAERPSANNEENERDAIDNIDDFFIVDNLDLFEDMADGAHAPADALVDSPLPFGNDSNEANDEAGARPNRLLDDPLLEDNEMVDAQQLVERIGDDDSAMEDDSDASEGSSDNVLADNTVAGRRRRWYISVDHMHSAIRELVALGRRGEGNTGNAQAMRDDLLHRMRRALFSLEHTAQRDRGDGGENAEPEDAEPEPEPENPVGFDTNLPAEHSYLGSNMNRVSGVNYLDVGQQYNMMLFMHQHVLFPGEVLPFMISGSVIESDMDSQNGLLFGVCFPSLRNESDNYFYGVTCQIYEKGTDVRGNTLIKSRALQRFVTKGCEFNGPLQFIAAHPQLKCYGQVKILPEIYLPEPLKCINMGSMNRFRDNESMKDTYRRYQAASTPWPVHVYNYYSISSIVEKARSQLAQHKIDTMPTDPIQLSFWLVRNLHLPETMMKTIFITDSVNLRMKLISSTFKENAVFTCRYCGNRIANCRELFAMSKHGVQTQYCNSAGYIHETNTVYQLLPDSIVYSGEPSSEFSWFPGYQWHIIVCKICSRHIGWKFKALEPNLVPKSFFGLSSSSVRVSASTYVPTDPRTTIYNNFMRVARRGVL